MADTFSVELPKNWHERWPEVQRAAKKFNFTVHRKGNDVEFTGYGVEGSIKVTGDTAHVVIDKKPFFISSSLIETKVRQFLEDYG